MPTVAQNITTFFRETLQVLESEFEDESISQMVVEAILEHNAGYLSDGSDLPSKEFSLVKLLTHAKLCDARATAAATQMNVRNQSGYGTDRNTPYYMNMDLATKLRAQYAELCTRMGISGATDDATSVVVGRLSVIDSTIAARTPYLFDQTPIKSPVLVELSHTDTSAKIEWTVSKDDTMLEYIIFGRSNAVVLDAANIEPVHGIPKISDSASRLTTVYDPRSNAREFTGLTTGVPYHFVVVVKNAQGRYAYSNELIVTPA